MKSVNTVCEESSTLRNVRAGDSYHSTLEIDMCRLLLNARLDRDISQAVSRRLATAAAGFRSQVRPCGVCGGQRGTRAGFLRVLRFPLPNLMPPTAPHSSSIIRGWYNSPISGRSTQWTQSHPVPRN
jgi:hypothetical protein